MQDWKTIWSRKQAEAGSGSVLAQLLDIDGFTSAFGRLDDTGPWMDYVEMQAKRLGMQPGDSLYEVGCGGGAFLYPFWQRGHAVAGADYAPNLVAVARRAMPGARLRVLEARDIPTEEPADVVVSNGVFLYFPDEDYAAAVLSRMVAMARRSIGIFDVCDLALKADALADRKAILGEAEYARMYGGLDHLYLGRDWFSRQLADRPVRVEVESQSLRGYGNSKYRYNVYIHL